jgi:hypothetical protein
MLLHDKVVHFRVQALVEQVTGLSDGLNFPRLVNTAVMTSHDVPLNDGCHQEKETNHQPSEPSNQGLLLKYC